MQFVGHWFEGRKPAFVDDLVGLMVGPLFVVAEVAFFAGLRGDVRREVERRAGPCTAARIRMSDVPVCVFGAGAVGCYLGGRLAAAGANVTLVGRARIGDAIHRHGLTLTDQRGHRATLAPADLVFEADPAAAAAARLVLVAVKSAAT